MNNSHTRTWSKLLALVGAAAVVGLSLSGCTSGDAPAAPVTSDAATEASSSSLSSLLPQSIADAGVVQAASSFSSEPLYFLDEEKPAGALIELIDEAGNRLGVEVEWQHLPYTGLIAGLQADKIDVVGAQMSRTADNADAANFLAVYQTSTSLLVDADADVANIEDVCGLTLATSRGSALNVAQIDAIIEECKAQGLPEAKSSLFEDINQVIVAVRSGQVDVGVTSTPALVQAAKSVGGGTELKVVLQGELNPITTGFVLGVEDTELTEAFAAAFQDMMDDGSYDEILEKWDLGVMSIDTTYVNDDVPTEEFNIESLFG
jgi:polar amino acid transport system substrate-binding protein